MVEKELIWTYIVFVFCFFVCHFMAEHPEFPITFIIWKHLKGYSLIFNIPWKKETSFEINESLEWHESELMMTEFLFLA